MHAPAVECYEGELSFFYLDWGWDGAAVFAVPSLELLSYKVWASPRLFHVSQLGCRGINLVTALDRLRNGIYCMQAYCIGPRFHNVCSSVALLL